MKRAAVDNFVSSRDIKSSIDDLIKLLNFLIESDFLRTLLGDFATEVQNRLRRIKANITETVPENMSRKFKHLTANFRTEGYDHYCDILENFPTDFDHFETIVEITKVAINNLNDEIETIYNNYKDFLSSSLDLQKNSTTSLIEAKETSDEPGYMRIEVLSDCVIDHMPLSEVSYSEVSSSTENKKSNEGLNLPHLNTGFPDIALLTETHQLLWCISEGIEVDIPQEKKQDIINLINHDSIQNPERYMDRVSPEVLDLTLQIVMYVNQIGGKKLCIARIMQTQEIQPANTETPTPERLARTGLSDKLTKFVKKELNLPDTLEVSKAIANGGCFFDSLAQSLPDDQQHTEKYLRRLCYEYYEKDAHNKAKIEALNKEDCRRLDSDQIQKSEYPFMQYTQEEVDQNDFERKTAFWGRTHVEGPILCELLGLESFW